jgi:hypothetical protein
VPGALLCFETESYVLENTKLRWVHCNPFWTDVNLTL